MKKYILLFLLLAGSIFLAVPTDNAEAALYGCYQKKTEVCSNVEDENFIAGEKKCLATSPCGGDAGKCKAFPFACLPPGDYACRQYKGKEDKTGECTTIKAIDIAVASEKCTASCQQGGADSKNCTIDAGACPMSSGPGTGALKGMAQSALNKANFKSPVDLINRAIRILMAFIGSIALVLYIYSGFLWMTASGNTEQVGKAKTTMVWTTLGVVMMLASYMLASFIFKSLGV